VIASTIFERFFDQTNFNDQAKLPFSGLLGPNLLQFHKKRKAQS
jgi:hypothetical protein